MTQLSLSSFYPVGSRSLYFHFFFHLPPDFCPSGLNTLTDGFVSCFQHKHVCVSHKGTQEESTSFPTNDSIPTSVGMSSS